jgi:hypothetical protein
VLSLGISFFEDFSRNKRKSMFLTLFGGLLEDNNAWKRSLENINFFEQNVSCCCTFEVVAFWWRFMARLCLSVFKLCVTMYFWSVDTRTSHNLQKRANPSLENTFFSNSLTYFYNTLDIDCLFLVIFDVNTK